MFGLVRGPLVGSAAQEQASFDGRSAATVRRRRARRATDADAGRTAHAGAAARRHRLRVTAFGDSVLESAGPALRQVFPFLTVDADVGRQANEVFDEIAWLKLGDRLGQIVVIETGANGIVEPDELDDLLTKLSDRRRVVLVTVHAPRLWQDPNNEIFAAAAQTHPNTTVADWHAAASEHPEWLYPDGTHVRPGVRLPVRGDRQGAPRSTAASSSSSRTAPGGLAEAEDELRVFGHQLGRPGRVERQLGLDVLDARAPRARRG